MDLSACCHSTPLNVIDPGDEFSPEEAEEYAEKIFVGMVTKNELDSGYHSRITKILLKPILDNVADPGLEIADVSERLEAARAMRTNVFEFSAAKQYQQARAMSALVTPDSSFPKFKKEALKVFDEFNKNYLKTEYDTAIASTQAADNYINSVLSAEDFPLIQYKTQADARVRETHQSLHDITLPVNHPFWRRYWPPNGWNCRCFTVQLEAADVTDLKDIDLGAIREEVPDLFRQNPALSGELFDKKKHPYFKVARGDSELRDRNFNLPLE